MPRGRNKSKSHINKIINKSNHNVNDSIEHLNYNTVESKIKSMVDYDKNIHYQIKRQNENEARTSNDFN